MNRILGHGADYIFAMCTLPQVLNCPESTVDVAMTQSTNNQTVYWLEEQ